jgi:hypothetical protein
MNENLPLQIVSAKSARLFFSCCLQANYPRKASATSPTARPADESRFRRPRPDASLEILCGMIRRNGGER